MRDRARAGGDNADGRHRRQRSVEDRQRLTSLLTEGVELFNHGRYWDAHEAWEREWTPDRKGVDSGFYKGLIQVAAGCLHYTRRNRRGAINKWRSGADYLRPYLPAHRGIRLEPHRSFRRPVRLRLAGAGDRHGSQAPHCFGAGNAHGDAASVAYAEISRYFARRRKWAACHSRHAGPRIGHVAALS